MFLPLWIVYITANLSTSFTNYTFYFQRSELRKQLQPKLSFTNLICLICLTRIFLSGETIASAKRVEREDGELHPQHQLHHLR